MRETLKLSVLTILSIVLIISLYPKVHPLIGLKLELNKQQVLEKAEKVTAELNLESDEFRGTVTLRQDRDLIRFLQKQLGIEQANTLLLDELPGYYFEVDWDEKLTFVTGNSEENEDKKWNGIESVVLKFDLQGNLLSIEREIPDSLQVNSFSSASQAREYANRFLKNYSKYTFNSILSDSIAKQSTISSSTLDEVDGLSEFTGSTTNRRFNYEFSQDFEEKGIDKQRNIKMIIAGNQILSFETSFDIDSTEYGTAQIVNTIFEILTYFFFFFVMLFVGVKKLRAYEIGFKYAIIISIIVAVCSVINTFISAPQDMGWELLVLLFVTPLYVGGGMIVVWAISESIGRDVWPGKFRSLDLILNGFLLDSNIGKSLLRGLSMGLFAIAVMIGFNYIYANISDFSYLYTDEETITFMNTSQPILFLTTSYIYRGFFYLAFFVVLIPALFKKWIPIRGLPYILGAIIIGVIFRNYADPFYLGIIPLILVGAIFLGSFYRYDITTSLVAMFTYFVASSGFSTLFINDSVHPGMPIVFILGFTVLIIYAISTLFTKDKIEDYEKITPKFAEFINERQRLQRELEIARRVQMSFLPDKMPSSKYFSISARCEPAMEVGGDYYDFVPFKDGILGIAIGDVSGKGTPAAFYMTLTKGFLKATAQETRSAGDVLKKVNSLFYQNASRNTFISMVYAIFDPLEKKVTIARAGHNPVFHYRKETGDIAVIQPNGLALGLEKGEQFDQIVCEKNVLYDPDDMFIFFTDGLTEALDKHEQEFGEHRLKQSILSAANKNSDEVLDYIYKEVKRFSGRVPQHDDMSVVIIKINSV